jgi:hypothetical protein
MLHPIPSPRLTPDMPLYGPERELMAEIRNLTGLVSELTLTLVVQGAWLSALRNGRRAPLGMDVDAAIATVTSNVPDEIADGLWESRDAILARVHNREQG